MKLQCSIEKIKDGIYKAERVTGKNLTLPVLSSILFVASGKSLKLRATNLSLGIEIEIPAKIEKEGVAAVSGSVLSGIFSNMFQGENVHIESEDGNLMVKTKKTKIKLKGQPHEDFPTLPTVSGSAFEIEAKKLTDGIKSVYYSSAVSDIKPEISSVYIYSDKDSLVFVSTDSFRLAEKKIKLKKAEEVPGVLVPFKNIPEILRVLGESPESLKVNFNKNLISFSSDNVYLTSRVIDGVFPDYRQIITGSFDTETIVLKQDLLNALKLSNIFSDKFNQVNFLIKPKEKIFELSSKNTEVGENKTDLDATLKGTNIELSFSYKYFSDCFQSISSDSVLIRLNQSSKPMAISGVSDNSFIYLVMPMNK